MFRFFSKISSKKKHIAIITLVFIIAILFEALQQIFYIKRFNLAQNIQFFDILKSQSYKWFIWVVLSSILIWYTKQKSSQKNNNYFLYGAVILGLVFLSVIIISIIQFSISNDTFSWILLFDEYVTFFTFQKAPIYTLGYIAIAIIMHFYFTNEALQIKVEGLSELKKTNANLYKKLSKYNDDNTRVLNIKIGNKRKIIPVTDIYWIEADDYCVKVHTNKNNSYTMRSSLKALNDKLSNNFLRVHRKAIVNMDVVKELNMSSTPKLILNNNIEISISKSNLKLVKDFIG
ncbi:hypothetical protein BFR04_15910 [Gaetbulibacter sp. 4G1]|nr:LytTR family DNA-binding domain-containing protein [Gaetbulibacter sp. 4G1]PIA80693.1 hypothetical protein BFR04_15910 [Gaetbulibacter sp. 4G1]